MEKNGSAIRLPSRYDARQSYIIWWRTREDWAELVYQWVQATGSHNKVYLVADLIDDNAYSDAVFFGLPFAVLRDILLTLEKSGRAKLIQGSGGSSTDAVKFAVV